MSNVIAEVTTELLQAFADAWNRHDVDALMSFMTTIASSKPLQARRSAAPGTRAGGRASWLRGSLDNLSRCPLGQRAPFCPWGQRRVGVDVHGNRADGTRVEVHGCDLFTFRDGKIALKNSYRKNRPQLQR